MLLPVAFKATLETRFEEFQAPVWELSSKVREVEQLWGYKAHTKNELIEAGIDLSRRNAAYRLVQQRNEELLREVGRLERILHLPPLPHHRFEVARVARRELSAWWQELIIRKGRDYGIPEGAPVIYGDGVVGRIKEVRATTSVVELVSSRSFRMAANFEGDSRPVTYQGVGQGGLALAYGEVRDVPADKRASVEVPLRLVSSPLGGVFPAGLTIGQVVALEPDANGLFNEGRLRLSPDLLGVMEVAVLVPVEPDEEGGHAF